MANPIPFDALDRNANRLTDNDLVIVAPKRAAEYFGVFAHMVDHETAAIRLANGLHGHVSIWDIVRLGRIVS